MARTSILPSRRGGHRLFGAECRTTHRRLLPRDEEDGNSLSRHRTDRNTNKSIKNKQQTSSSNAQPLVFKSMTTKRITVDGFGVKLSSNDGLRFLLESRGGQSLLDNDGDEVGGFDSLVDGGKYRLGPPSEGKINDFE